MTWRRLARIVAGTVVVSLVISGPVWAVQCAPYARQISGINLYGNAWTWWQSAAGLYDRGNRPQVGAALVFKQTPHMPSGHVAIVTAVVSARVIKVDHANWAPRGALKGAIHRSVPIIDESPNNDWSQVRVWYPPIHSYGRKIYPVYGFIYPNTGPNSPPAERLAANEPPAEQLAADEPHPEQLAANEPSAEQLATNEPHPEQLAANEPRPERVDPIARHHRRGHAALHVHALQHLALATVERRREASR